MLAWGEARFGKAELFCLHRLEFCCELLAAWLVSPLLPALGSSLIWVVCFGISLPTSCRQFRTFPLEARGLLVWDEACQTLGVSPWQAGLQSRFRRVWKSECLKLIPVLGRKKWQMMDSLLAINARAAPEALC